MFVEKNVARDIKHIFKLGRDDDFYRQAAIKEAIWLQKLWKKTKTSYNPGTHVANSLSNIMFTTLCSVFPMACVPWSKPFE